MGIQIVKYNSSAIVSAGWRKITIEAEVEVEKKMAVVKNVLKINGEEPAVYQERIGSKPQTHSARAIALMEVGFKKRLSSCWN